MNYKINHESDLLAIGLQASLIGGGNGPGLIEPINGSLNNKIKCAVDIQGAIYINSNGIRALIAVPTKFRNKGGELIIVNPSVYAKKPLVIIKINSVFTILVVIGEVKEELNK